MKERVFIDEALVTVNAGDGGRGCVAFRREKYVPRGGPSGGDGGRGGSVYVEATVQHNTLFHFKKYPHIKAQRGQHGMGSQCHGKNGEDTVMKVPVGTTIIDDASGEIVADLTADGERILVAKGGKGGKGNARFATSINQAPRYAEDGGQGVERILKLELKLMAQIGLVGLPNAGKSTLLSALTAARPRVAPYPFTTLTPQMGVVVYEDGSTRTVADIPGIIEGAHEGKGLGLQFLRHIERVSLLCHLVDVSPESGGADDIAVLEAELQAYGHGLSTLPRILVATKIDTLSGRDVLEPLRLRAEKEGCPFIALSSLSREGLNDLLKLLREKTA